MTDPGSIERLLRPRSVAIVGASPTPGALGASVLANLERAGYAGEIHLVNPKRSEINGRPCVPTVDALPAGVDCAVLAIPRAAVVSTIEACARRGVGGAVIFSAGFAEAGPEGRAEQAEIARIARAHGIVVEGPNCLGFVNFVDGVPLTFVQTPGKRLTEPGLAIVSQSGAMAGIASVVLRSRDLGISFSVSTGNEAASGVEDYIEYLIADPHTRVIALIVEQFRSPKRFLALARRAREQGKPIVLVHPGRSSAARESAATHTGAMAGDFQVMSTKVRHAGVALVDTLEELLDTAELAARLKSLPTRGAAVLVESGWFKALSLDLAEQIGLEFPALSPDCEAGLRQALPDFIPPSNPLDLTAQALVDPDLYRRTMAVLMCDDRIGSNVLGNILTDPSTCGLKFPPIFDALRTLERDKPIIFAQMDEGAEIPPTYIEQLRELGVPFFPSPERALRALARLTEFAAREIPAEAELPGSLGALPETGGVIPEYRSKEILAAAGIPIPTGSLAQTADEAVAIAERIGFPVVLKAQSPELSHKSDAGGVVLGLGDGEALRQGWAQLHASVGRARPELALDGVLVEKMGERGTELIVGGRNDPEWGPVVLVGFGGVMAELFHDVRLLPPELPAGAIERELQQLKSSALFRGFRGSPALDVAAAAEIVARVAALMRAQPRIREIDVNPVVVYPAGRGAVALDALMLLD